MNTDTILKVIEKVRNFYKHTKYHDIVERNAYVNLKETNGNLKFCSIEFNFYDTIYVTDNQIILKPEHGTTEVLLTFNSIEEYLNL